MRRRKVWVISPLFYLMAVVMLGMALVTYRYNKIAFAVELTLSGLAILAVSASDLLFRRNITTAVKNAKMVLKAQE